MKQHSIKQNRGAFGPSLSSKIWIGMGIVAWVLAKHFIDRNPDTADLSFELRMLLSMLFGLPFGLLALWADRVRSRRNQLQRDLRACQTMDDVLSGRVSSYSLYLRPFYTTGLLETDLERFDGLGSYLAKGGAIDFETQLAQLVPEDEPLVALGRPGEINGAGRIETENETWKLKFDLLAKNAKWIYLLPLERPGTLWEVNYLISNSLLHKTTFLMPPSKSIDLQNKWNVARSTCRELGIRLPEYHAEGGYFFRICPEGISYAHTRELNVTRAANPPKHVELKVHEDPVVADSCPKCRSRLFVQLKPEDMLGEAGSLVECEACHTQYNYQSEQIALLIGVACLVASPVLGSLLVYGIRTNEWRDLLFPPVAFVFLVTAILTLVLPVSGASILLSWVMQKRNPGLQTSSPSEQPTRER